MNVERLVAASSLSALIEARARLAALELAALDERHAELEARYATAAEELVLAMEARTDRAAALQRREARLAKHESELARVIEAAEAKRGELARLAERARVLATAGDGADLAVLREMAEDAARAATLVSRLASEAAGTAEPTRALWRWPLAGVLTQPFGPSGLALEPSVRYRDVLFPHFHDAIDIAAPLGTPVVAASAGRVTFVGHLPDGAMVVLVAHDDGLVSLSAHLDDTFAPPRVAKGDRVAAGQVVGYVGVTGITTGPHLHFSVRSASGPIDPLVVLGGRGTAD